MNVLPDKLKINTWFKFGLVYGIGMIVVMELLFPLVIGEPIGPWVPLIGKSLFWIVIGLGLGYFLKITKSIKS